MSGAASGTGEEMSTDSPDRGGFRDVLAIPAFRRLWLAQLGSQLGESIARDTPPLPALLVIGS